LIGQCRDLVTQWCDQLLDVLRRDIESALRALLRQIERRRRLLQELLL